MPLYWHTVPLLAGDTDIALAGGSEASVPLGSLLVWAALLVLSFDTCLPFSKDRNGLVIGEGSAMLVLEVLEHAEARGLEFYGEIAGFGSNTDAGDLTAPNAKSAARATKRALQDAGLQPGDAGYVNAHGAGAEMNTC
jgi:nodulation protein E